MLAFYYDQKRNQNVEYTDASRWQSRLITELNQGFFNVEIRKVRKVKISNSDVMSTAFSTYPNPKAF